MAKIIITDEGRCLACKSCMIACAMAHTDAETLVEALGCESLPQSRLHVEPGGVYGVPLQCRHCEDAPCITVCPTDAISRDEPDAPVVLDQDTCTGCEFCMLACPFGVIDISREAKAMIKCDLCIERTKAGEPPACVAACPTGAIEHVELDDSLRRRRREAFESVAEPETPAEADVNAEKAKTGPARCESCGMDFSSARKVKFIQSKLGGRVSTVAICPACRRSRTVEKLSRARKEPARQGAG